jgi:hypothetical protein
MTQLTSHEISPAALARHGQDVPRDHDHAQATTADLTRIKYGAWLIAAAFLLLGTVFGVAVSRYRSAADVAAVVGTLATVTGTILGAFFGAQVGSAGKDAAEAGRRKAERTAQMALGKLDPTIADEVVRHL